MECRRTCVKIEKSLRPYRANDRSISLGSCFSAEIGARMKENGFDICINPFGTLFNPASIASSLRRLATAQAFSEQECIQMGAGSKLWCDFSHYTKFARAKQNDFLENANTELKNAAGFYASCSKVLITFGTAWVFRYFGDTGHPMYGKVVSNCLKRPAGEFVRERLSVGECVSLFKEIIESAGTFDLPGIKEKDFVFTVSPIRHMADGAYGNLLSKSTLLLAIEEMTKISDRVEYFPAYEIMTDQLRDYSWYAEDMVHPSAKACDVIWEGFRTFSQV